MANADWIIPKKAGVPLRTSIIPNDTDPDGDAVRFAHLIGKPKCGKLRASNRGVVAFLPPKKGCSRRQRAVYVATDGKLQSNKASIFLPLIYPPRRTSHGKKRPPLACPRCNEEMQETLEPKKAAQYLLAACGLPSARALWVDPYEGGFIDTATPAVNGRQIVGLAECVNSKRREIHVAPFRFGSIPENIARGVTTFLPDPLGSDSPYTTAFCPHMGLRAADFTQSAKGSTSPVYNFARRADWYVIAGWYQNVAAACSNYSATTWGKSFGFTFLRVQVDAYKGGAYDDSTTYLIRRRHDGGLLKEILIARLQFTMPQLPTVFALH